MSIAKERRESLFFRAISEIIAHQLRNANIAQATVTSVKLSNDSKHLTVYVIFEKHQQRSLQFLKNASGFIRKQLAQAVDARVVPTLVFKYDDSFDRGKRIDQIIEDLKKS